MTATVVTGANHSACQLQALHANDAPAERAPVAHLVRGWSQFVALRDTGVLGSQGVVAGGLAGAARRRRTV